MSKEEHGQSELAKLLQQINEETTAAQRGFAGYAEVSKHEFITARMERLGHLQEELEKLVGSEQAVQIIVKAMERKED
jgi:hypothetical protein